MKKAVALILILCILCSALCACGDKGTKLIGAWEEDGGSETITFYDDGTCILMGSYSATWAIVNGNELKITYSGEAHVYTFDIAGTTLTLSENNQTATFERVD